jgi:hypothetical protein
MPDLLTEVPLAAFFSARSDTHPITSAGIHHPIGCCPDALAKIGGEHGSGNGWAGLLC